MKPENRQIFEENRIHWETLTKAGYLKHLSGPARSGLMRAMSEEFQPGYTADLWCPTCVSNMILQVYRRYNEFVEQEKQQEEARQHQAAANPQPPTDLTAEEIQKMMEPIELPPFEELFPNPDPPEEVKPPADPQPELDPEPPPPSVQTKANFPSHKNRKR